MKKYPDILETASELMNEEIEDKTSAISAKANAPATPDTECRECGAPIGKTRKEKVPSATLCIDCAEIEERKQRC